MLNVNCVGWVIKGLEDREKKPFCLILSELQPVEDPETGLRDNYRKSIWARIYVWTVEYIERNAEDVSIKAIIFRICLFLLKNHVSWFNRFAQRVFHGQDSCVKRKRPAAAVARWKTKDTERRDSTSRGFQ
ncbi:hypothetical protein RUM44_001505 [Polyplax serrata]|uniref:Uncharacterized protein n=1 Tax=Polyplax serrata TaxID=468196 RepID=A0ABR1AK85_POLSC